MAAIAASALNCTGNERQTKDVAGSAGRSRFASLCWAGARRRDKGAALERPCLQLFRAPGESYVEAASYALVTRNGRAVARISDDAAAKPSEAVEVRGSATLRTSGRLVCASVGRSGRRPHASERAGARVRPLFD